MGQLSSFHILGSIITLTVIMFIGIHTDRKVKDEVFFILI